jgi:hypothetical protein
LSDVSARRQEFGRLPTLLWRSILAPADVLGAGGQVLVMAVMVVHSMVFVVRLVAGLPRMLTGLPLSCRLFFSQSHLR